jgi:hypothetical protein
MVDSSADREKFDLAAGRLLRRRRKKRLVDLKRWRMRIARVIGGHTAALVAGLRPTRTRERKRKGCEC